ncbi:hypothetical protein HDU76_010421 [Blyttiomyces sp. JEL0837]|nr:hypothetical protein HDU76_010421 [Blyttiomyces sp. JEL0837]
MTSIPTSSTTSTNLPPDLPRHECPKCHEADFIVASDAMCMDPWHEWEFNSIQGKGAYMEGQYRKSADTFLDIYKQSDPKTFLLRYLYLYLHGLITAAYGLRTMEDIREMKEIEKNESEAFIDRMQCAIFQGISLCDFNDYDGAATRLLRALELGELARKDPVYIKSFVLRPNTERMSFGSEDDLITSLMNRVGWSPVDDEIKGIEEVARAGLCELSTLFRNVTIRYLVPYQGFLLEGESIRGGEDWRKGNVFCKKVLDMPVSGIMRCAGCHAVKFRPQTSARDPSGSPINVVVNVDINLRKCTKCLRVAYCSTKCQSGHWKHGGHRERCREPDDFANGDVVVLKGLENQTDMNGMIGEVVGKAADKGDGIVRYQFFNFAVTRRSRTMVVKSGNMVLKVAAEDVSGM